MASNRNIIEVQQYVKKLKIKNCVLLTSGADSPKDSSKDLVYGPGELPSRKRV